MNRSPQIIAVKAKPDFTLELTFDNGQERIFNMKPYLSIGVFKELQNFSLFKKAKPFYGSISWASGQDLSNDTLYLRSKKVLGAKSRKIKYRSPAQTPPHAVAEPHAKYKKR